MNLLNRFLVLTLLLTIAIFLGNCKSESQDKKKDDEVEENSETAIQLEDLEGNDINLKDYHGKTVILNFWATWCKPCIAEMSSFDRLLNNLGKEGYIFLSASDETIDKIKRFADKNPHDFKYVHLKSNVYLLNISVLPTTYIINTEGEVIEKVVGAREWDSEESVNLIRGI